MLRELRYRYAARKYARLQRRGSTAARNAQYARVQAAAERAGHTVNRPDGKA